MKYLISLALAAACFAAHPSFAQGVQYPVERPDTYFNEGRDEFLVTTGLLGAIQGPLVYVAVEGEEPVAYSHALAIVGGAALGVGVPYVLTHGMPISRGEAAFTMYGGLQGYMHGGALINVFMTRHSTDTERVAVISLTSFSQSVLAFLMAKELNLTPELSGMMFYHSVFGYLTGYFLADVFIGEDLLFDNNSRTASAFGLAGSALGNVAGYLLTGTGNYTRDDARVIGGFGFLGLESALVISAIAGFENDRLAYGSMAAGILGGLTLGSFLMDAPDLSGGQGYTFNAGILIGTGIGFFATSGIISASIDDRIDVEYRWLPLLPLAGALAGAGIAYASFDTSTDDETADVMVRPSLLYADGAGSEESGGSFLPGMRLRYTF